MQYSGQKAVTTAGAAERLTPTSFRVLGSVMVKAKLANTQNVFIGNDGAGDVSATTGIELDAGDYVIFEHIGDLTDIWVDAQVNGEGVSWIVLKWM